MARKRRTLKLRKQDLDNAPGPPPGSKQKEIEYAIEGHKWLKFYVTKSGARGFRVRGHFNGKKWHGPIGHYPEITKEEAAEIAARYKSQISRGIDPLEKVRQEEQNAITFAVFVTTHLIQYLKQKNKSWEKQVRQLKRFWFPRIGEMRLRDITAADIERGLQDLAALGRTGAPINRLRAIASTTFSHALRLAFVDKNIVKFVPKRAESPPRDGVLDPKQLAQFIAAARALQSMAGALLGVLACCGCRIGEIRGCLWSDINWTDGTVHLKNGETKNKRGRRVPLNSLALQILKEQRDRVPVEQPFVFPSRKPSQHIVDVRWTYNRLLAKIGADPSLVIHSLRHSCATTALLLGEDLYSVSLLLGHVNTAITQRNYAHAKNELETRTSNRLGDSLARLMEDAD